MATQVTAGRWSTHSLTHSLTYSLTHSLTHSPTHLLTHPLTKVGENACMRFNATSGTIFSPDCAGLCLVVRDSMPVLGDCNSPDAKGWTTHA